MTTQNNKPHDATPSGCIRTRTAQRVLIFVRTSPRFPKHRRPVWSTWKEALRGSL